MPIANETHTINGCAVHVRKAGTGKPVLWLHGTDGPGDQSDAWPAMLDRLAERHTVIAPDIPGFGATPVPDWMDDVSDLAYLHLGLLDQMGLERAHVIGHSLGGWVAAEMAVRSTARIGTLSLIAPAGLAVKGAAKADIFMIDPDEQARLAYASPELGEAAAERAKAAKDQEAAIANRVASARFGWSPRFHNPRLGRWLCRIDRPTLIVWGEEDRIFAPAHATAFAAAIGGSRVAMIPGAGHLPHIEKPDETLAAITAHIGA